MGVLAVELAPEVCLVEGATFVCDALFSHGESLFSQGESPDSSCANREHAEAKKTIKKKQILFILFKICKQSCVDENHLDGDEFPDVILIVAFGAGLDRQVLRKAVKRHKGK